MDKHICGMTREEFLSVPTITDLKNNPIYCKFVVVIPMDTLVGDIAELRFEQRFREMIIVAIDSKSHPIYKVKDDIDIISFNNFGYEKHPKRKAPRKWSMDCLPTSGLLCLNTDKYIKIYECGRRVEIDGYIDEVDIPKEPQKIGKVFRD
jgi:hypothetical protein